MKYGSNVPMFLWSNVLMFKCSLVQRVKCSNVQMFKFKSQKSIVKYQMSVSLNFCRIVPPESLRYFLDIRRAILRKFNSKIWFLVLQCSVQTLSCVSNRHSCTWLRRLIEIYHWKTSQLKLQSYENNYWKAISNWPYNQFKGLRFEKYGGK